MWCKIRLRDSDSLLVGVIYRFPSSSADNDKLMCNLITSAVNCGNSHLLIFGDFNLPNTDWSTWSTTPGDTAVSMFIESLYENYLFQHVNFSTRVWDGQHPSLLDLVVTTEENMIRKICSSDPLGKSNHVDVVLEIEFLCYINSKNETFACYS